MKGNVIYSRALLYEDCSGIETGVEYDPTLRLGGDDKSYVRIKGVGDDVAVRVDHIPVLIDWLSKARAIDLAYREGNFEGFIG